MAWEQRQQCGVSDQALLLLLLPKVMAVVSVRVG
jgi:hypothetical protein